MIYIFIWIICISVISIILKFFLVKKYNCIMDLFMYKNKRNLHLETVSLKPLRGNKDKNVQKIYYLILIYKIFFWINFILFPILLNKVLV